VVFILGIVPEWAVCYHPVELFEQHMATSDIQPDESGSKPVAAAVTAEESPKTHRAFSRLKRELSDEELNSSGVQKLLLDILAQTEDEVATLKSFRDKFYEADKRNGVLEEKWKVHIRAEVISTGTVAAGAAALVYAASVWSMQPTAGIALAAGIVLTLTGIGAKVIQK